MSLQKVFIALLILCLSNLGIRAKLANTFDQNKGQYGEPISVEPFPSKTGFTGYASYKIDKEWKLKAFFINGKVRTEHLVPQKQKSKSKLSRSEVREWAKKMFAPGHRGNYRRKISQHRVEGHFFDRGLIAYEYLIKDKATIGYQSVKVLFYEKDKWYNKINPKAYL